MAKKTSAEHGRSATLVAAVRDGLSPAAQDEAAVAWLQGEGSIDALDADAGLAAVAAALELGAAERIAAAGEARAKDVRKAARAAAHKLRSAGVELPRQAVGTSWSLGREDRVMPPPRALIGLPEEDGYVPFLLASYGEGTACLSGGAAGPVRGFRDDDHGHTSLSQARKVLDGASGDHRMFDLPFHEALGLLFRAFDAAGPKRPAGWDHLLSHVDSGTQTSARILDPLRDLASALDVDALHRPDVLLVGRWSCAPGGDPEVMQGFVGQAIEALTAEDHPDEAARRQAVDEVIDAAATAALAGPLRTSWTFGLNVLALLAHRAEDPEVAAVARATALALDEGRPGADIPWAREAISRQLSWVTQLAIGMAEGIDEGEGEGEGEGAE